MVHDYLYWAQPCSRLQADNLLMIAMKQAGVPWVRRQLVYRGVRAQGAAVWRRNADERAIGMPHINPYRHAPDGLTWPQLRARIFHRGIRDVRHAVPDRFCRYGNRRDFPGLSHCCLPWGSRWRHIVEMRRRFPRANVPDAGLAPRWRARCDIKKPGRLRVAVLSRFPRGWSPVRESRWL